MIVPPADRLKDVGEYYFSRKLEQIRQMRARGLDVINLGIGSPDLTPPPEAIEAASRALQQAQNHGYASYRSLPELRRSLADWYKRTYRVELEPETQLLPLLGSKEGILYVSMAFLNVGDGVLVPNPGYPAYASVAKLLGARIHSYDLTEESGWLPDLDALKKRDLSGCKLMWVNYPHMPTGAPATSKLFRELADFAREKRILICNDNPYSLVLHRGEPLSLLDADPALECCAELNSLSKAFNMAGWRVGMFLGAKDVVNAVLQVKSNVDSGMFLPVQAGAMAALLSEARWHDARNQVYEERRQRVFQLFDQLGFRASRDQVGLFVWARAPDTIRDVPAFLDEILERANVFLTPGVIFGSNGERHARASLCVSRERLVEALGRLRQI